MDEELAIPDLPGALTPDQLRAIYDEAEPSRASSLGLKETSPEEWERVRKYAYARYWQGRLATRAPIEESGIETWKRSAALSFLHNVACGIMGDAARANLLTSSQVDDLLTCELTAYARRALTARRLLMSRKMVDACLIDTLLDVRGAWALHELLHGDLDANAIAALASAIGDRRLSRAERHDLRRALENAP
jgi:hypothetical protein